MTNQERDEALKVLNDKIEYWTLYKKNNPSSPYYDVNEIIDDLRRQKYDLLHATHTVAIVEAQRKIYLLQSLYNDANIFKRRKYLHQLKKERQKIVEYSEMDRYRHGVIFDYDKDSELSHTLK